MFLYNHELPQSSQMQSQPEKSCKIVVAGDFLLHWMNDKMSVDNITSVKLTKKVTVSVAQ